MINLTKRIAIVLPSSETTEKDLVPFFKQIESLIPENTFRRFQSARILGKLPDGKERGAIIVGDTAKEQLEYVDKDEDFEIKTPDDFKKLYIISADKTARAAIVVIQF